jgi:hypothetical protein
VSERALPAIVVVALLGCAVVIYPFYPRAGAQDRLVWSAGRTYLNTTMEDEGFELRCQRRPTQELSCALLWIPAGTSQRHSVYVCNDEENLRREAVLRRFLAAAPPGDASLRAAGIVDGFFHSGLRRECDRLVRTSSETTRDITPFKWRSATDTVELARDDVVALGLPARPAFRGDIVADGGPLATDPMAARRRVSRMRLLDSTRAGKVLDPVAPETCRIWPGGSDVNCSVASVVTVHPCAPGAGPVCANTGLSAHAMASGRVLLGGGTRPMAPVVFGSRLETDELIVVGPRTTIVPLPLTDVSRGGTPSVLEITSESRLILSRVRLLNGRWERWYAPDMRPWLEPLAGRLEDLARKAQRPQEQAIELALNLDLQRGLEDYLQAWMRRVEPDFTTHLQSRHANGSLRRRRNEFGHRRAVPQAGITVLRVADGAVLAVATYPPAEALDRESAAPSLAPGWQARLVGTHPSPELERAVAQILVDRVVDETNANFVRHPIGSTFKPLLLSLMIDRRDDDQLHKLFDLQVTGHQGNGQRGFPGGAPCTDPGVQAIAGHELGPWGEEEPGTSHGGAFIDRAEFLLDSCNKYAVTLGVLSLLDWRRQGNPAAVCWSARRDAFGFTETQELDGSTPPPSGLAAPPDWNGLVSRAADLAAPPVGLSIVNANSTRLADQPVFRRLQEYYGVAPRSTPSSYDANPWRHCAGLTTRDTRIAIGRVETTQLDFTDMPVGTPYTNIFTGANRNWWTNVKLAEAYARLATNRRVQASFCEPPREAVPRLFQETPPIRHRELVQILSRQRLARWVHVPTIAAWVTADSANRTVLSKTGTTVRDEGHQSTGIFVIYLGRVVDRTLRRIGSGLEAVPVEVGDGFVVVAHVEDLGTERLPSGGTSPASGRVTALVDGLFGLLERGLE